MTPEGFLRLSWQTVVAPREVARLLLSLRLGHEALFLCFAIVVVLNTLLFSLSAQIAPPSEVLRPILSSPLIFMLILASTLAITALSITWTGRAMGGKARLEGVGLLIIWLQAMRLLVQGGVLLIMPLSQSIAGLLVVAASAFGIWILVNFIDAAHEFASLFKAALVLLLGLTGMALGLSLFLGLIGATTMGLNTNV